jgi:hypothetical protein
MDAYSRITPFGHYRKTWVSDDCREDDSLFWRQMLNERLELLLQNTFSDSIISESILSGWQSETGIINAMTIDGSLRSLQKYLGFEFPHPSEVINYLLQHRNFYDIVLLACVLTEEQFGQNSQISLELYSDPEIDDQYLTIYVRQTEYEPDIMKKIDLICEDYTKVMDIDQGYLLVTTDFQPPRD